MNPFEAFISIKQRLQKTLGNNISIGLEELWTFPDKHIELSTNMKQIVSIRSNDITIGLMAFKIDPLTRTINILFLQGIKDQKQLRDWPELLIREFIIACIPAIKRGFSVNISRAIGTIVDNIRELERGITEETKKIELNRGETSEETYWKRFGAAHIKEYKTRLEEQQRILLVYYRIRDKFFNKTGELNPKRHRVAEILKPKELEPCKKPKARQKPK